MHNGGSEWQNDYIVPIAIGIPDYYSTFFRNYDAALGRWTGVDPMADAVESMSPYQYAGNNPGMINDPMGDLFDINTPTGTSDNRAALDRTYQEVQSMVYSAQGWTGALDFADWTPEAQKGEGGGGGGHFKTWDEVAEAVGRLQSTDSGGALNFAHGGYATSGTDVYGYATELDGITAGAATMARNGSYGKYDGWAKSYANAVDNYNVANHTNYFIGNTNALQSVGVWNARDANGNSAEDANGVVGYFHGVNVVTGEDAEAIVMGEGGGIDWRSEGEAALSFAGGLAELAVAATGEWFSGGLATPIAAGLAVDGSTRMALAFGKAIAGLTGTKGRNLPGNLGGIVGFAMGGTKGQKIGGLVNDAFTVFITGGTAGTMISIMDPAISFSTKTLTVGAQASTYYDVLNNGGVIK